MRYHVFTLSVGSHSVDRIYMPQTDDCGDETAARKRLKRSQQRRVIGYRLARPTSDYRRIAEADGTTFPAPIPTRRRTRRAAV